MTRKFIKKPIVVEAFKFGYDEEPSWFESKEILIDYDENGVVVKGCIHTLEGDMWFQEGDYVIKGIKGELYPCKGHIFEETYNEINSSIS